MRSRVRPKGAAVTPDLLLVHYHEIGLKGRNRHVFERGLKRNLERALGLRADPLAERVRVLEGRLEIVAPKPDALAAVTKVFGVANVAPVLVAPAGLEEIVRTAIDVAGEATFETFAVRARRAHTAFPHTSQAVNERVGDVIRTSLGKRVNLSRPDLTVRIEIVGDRAYVSALKVPGPGGLPVGTAGPVVALLSAGIDSPVALWRLMKRGSSPTAIHFHGQPFTDPSSERKVARILDTLRPWGYRRPWWSVPLGEAQREITVTAPPPLRTLLYRRLMLRVAERIAAQEGALAIVTGESLGQVASQTLENMVAIDAAATMPVLRPLVGTDKIEIVEDAERIGTYDVSVEVHQDCCSLFEPREPATRSDPVELARAEEAYDVAALVEDAHGRAVRRER
jgi:thiamine biosynthesis protein ThiI